MQQFDTYIICATTRSGSTLLCRLLSDTCVAGKPASYFHMPSVSSWAGAVSLQLQESAGEKENLRAVLHAVKHNGSGSSNVFGLRLMRKSFDFLMLQLEKIYPDAHSDAARLEAAFGRTLYIHLTRTDKTAQAISLVKANQTGLWHQASDGCEIERTAPQQPPRYDAKLIAENIAELTFFDEQWESWFETQQITPHRLSYESLSDDPVGTVENLLHELGLNSAAAKGLIPTVAKLADAISLDWAERYRTTTSPDSTSTDSLPGTELS